LARSQQTFRKGQRERKLREKAQRKRERREERRKAKKDPQFPVPEPFTVEDELTAGEPAAEDRPEGGDTPPRVDE
jgi:hypothetical protein